MCSRIKIDNFTKDLESTMTIIAFVNKDATEEEIELVRNKILEIKNIKSDELIYKDKEKNREETIEDTEENSPLYAIMNSWDKENNPLESEFIISVRDVQKMKGTAETIKKIDNITNVQYSEDVIKKMVPTFDIIEKIDCDNGAYNVG